MIADLIADYLINSETLRVEIESSAKVGDLVLLERSAHSLKSSSKLLGLDALSEVAYRIEGGARGGRVALDEVRLISLYLVTALDELTRFRDSRPRRLIKKS